MNKTLVYLIYFVVYSVFLLVVGKATSRASDSLDKFFVGERKMGVFRLFLRSSEPGSRRPRFWASRGPSIIPVFLSSSPR